MPPRITRSVLEKWLDNPSNNLYYLIFKHIARICYALFPHGMTITICARYYGLYYDIKYSIYYNKGIWSNIITNDFVNTNKKYKFYINNKKTLGNYNFMFKYVWGPIYIIHVIILLYVVCSLCNMY